MISEASKADKNLIETIKAELIKKKLERSKRDSQHCYKHRGIFVNHFKHQPHKMVKHTQAIRRQQPTNCLSASDYFVGWGLKCQAQLHRFIQTFAHHYRNIG